MTLSSDERTVLLIAAQGEPMMPIGRWRAPAEHLVELKLLKATPHAGDPTGFFNLRITTEGRKAVAEVEAEDDQALRDMVMLSNSIGHEQTKIRATAEQIAVQLVDITEASAKVTGEAKVEALRKWGRVILERALEMIGRA